MYYLFEARDGTAGLRVVARAAAARRGGHHAHDDVPGALQRHGPPAGPAMTRPACAFPRSSARSAAPSFVSLACPSLVAPSRCRSAPAWAVEPFVLKDIRVEGLQRTDAGTVFASLPFRIGDTYTDEKGAAALRALFATGLFKDVRIDIDGDVVVVIVDERAGHRQHRLRRHEGVRQGRAHQVAEGLRHRRRPAVRQGAGRSRRAGAQAPVPDAQPVRRRGRDHGDAAGAQPRQRHLHGHRRRRRRRSARSASSATRPSRKAR